MFFISLAILIVTLGAFRLWPERSVWFENNKQKLSKYIFIFSVIAIFACSFYFSYQQYQIWLKNDVFKHLLPPYASINYFIFYSFARFFAPYLASLTVAILFFFSAKILNKKYEERFFEPEEYYFGALSIFLVSHPGWLFYSTLLIFIYLLMQIVALAKNNAEADAEKRGNRRLSAYYLWLPVAIFVILISRWLQDLPLWSLLKL